MREELNRLGRARRPFFFAVDYGASEWYLRPLDALDADVAFDLDGFRGGTQPPPTSKRPLLHLCPVPLQHYAHTFAALQEEIAGGNTYLANLTQPTPVTCDATLPEIYSAATARFKLLMKDRFVVFSPERFIRIEAGRIETFPMKGTIDATLPGAEKQILSDPKELAEHTMVVDLLRNDLSMVASRVRVQRFRYTETIRAAKTPLIQVSSHITGELEPDWHTRIGDILMPLLPAGSITGTPKTRTVEILQKLEGYSRGFFTGICGYFDGERFDSAVMIRYIEQTPEGLVYKSGGGITADSRMRQEYDELVGKVYVPLS